MPLRRLRRTTIVTLVIVFVAGWAPVAGAGAIHDAINAGDAARVAQLLKQDPSLVRAQNENPTLDLPLHTAAAAGQVEVARMLLDAGAEIESLDRDESTPLHCAALSRKPEMVRFLLSRGADVNRRDKNGAYSLSFAASAGDSACVRMILDAGADLNFSNSQGLTLLHYACPRGLWWFVERLVASGSDINRGTLDHGTTPLGLVCQRGTAERVERMLALGASVAVADSDGATPLHLAAVFDRPDIARVLLDHGANVNAIDDGGATPLFWASRGSASLVQLLLERGADPNVRITWGQTPLLAAADAGNAESVSLLLQHGADPEATQPDLGFTPLGLAALLGYRDVAEAMLVGGADPNHLDANGNSPLELALQRGHCGVAEALAAHGAKANGSVPASTAPFVIPRAGADEAFVWSLGHSGWAVKTKGHFLIFDAGNMGRAPDQPSLRNGSIAPGEIRGEDVTVFVSHEHGDHYDPGIFAWKGQVPRIRYVLGFRPSNASMPNRTAAPAAAPQVRPEDYEYLAAGQVRQIDGMTVTTIESNDTGVGFVVEVDGVTIFHAGDHANRVRDLSGPFKPPIDRLVAQKIRPDLAFLPVSGCGFGDQVAVRIGVEYQLAQLRPRVLVPMHAGRYGIRLRDFVTEVGGGYPDTKMFAVTSPGDSFHYKRGSDL